MTLVLGEDLSPTCRSNTPHPPHIPRTGPLRGTRPAPAPARRHPAAAGTAGAGGPEDAGRRRHPCRGGAAATDGHGFPGPEKAEYRLALPHSGQTAPPRIQ
ncbi:hypothetical protein GCM10010259_05400 [Streptomyces daghestanicus]|uniref:Uncharacterized protein n=1 Tax=Streptomyces daghestanicus TaxID=66885 RepID=A0ABQ3Q936_9ACTN|nr:hypothetical protein GCM10010259_05400 [Streptomyces daghestanicus]GHI33769.1 hypothetical protein Sdagh_54990 [Streptomyces daghestanicus]